MKTLKNEKFSFKDMPLLDEKGKELNTLETIKLTLENSVYDNAGSVLKAMGILGKLPKEGEEITLEDADYDFVKRWVKEFKPLLSRGVMFAAFLQQFED